MNDPDTYRLQDSLPILDIHQPFDDLYASRKSILIVEDEEDLNHALAFRLRRAGFHVISTFDATSGLEKTGFHKPDLVLLDLVLPGMDGFGFLGEFLDIRKMRDIPVVLMSGYFDEEIRQGARALGVTEMLEKPVSHGYVVRKLAEILGVEVPGR
jgi:DNA-binding response OmpR family regulator